MQDSKKKKKIKKMPENPPYRLISQTPPFYFMRFEIFAETTTEFSHPIFRCKTLGFPAEPWKLLGFRSPVSFRQCCSYGNTNLGFYKYEKSLDTADNGTFFFFIFDKNNFNISAIS